MIIAVVGGNRAPSRLLAEAESVGRELSRHGCTLICGGRGGIMEAACRGARAEGGHTIGIMPGTDSRDMNAYVEFPIVTGMGLARNVIIVRTAEAVIAIGGAYGTLSEVAHALNLGKPVIGLHTWRFANDNVDDSPVVRARDAQDAVEKAVAVARERASHVDAN
jgi:uncharacterized protein (TIGR00725 family)